MTADLVARCDRDDPHEAASAWFLRLRSDPDADAVQLFEAWLEADPANQEAFTDVRAAWEAFDDAGAAPEIVSARRDALTRARRAARARWGVRRRPAFAALAAGLVFAIVAAPVVWRVLSEPAPAAVTRYATDVGETRVVTLADNSRVSLDAKTELNVRYTREFRHIELENGQAFFNVSSDPSRPFRVTAGAKTVVALGTAFNVEIVGEEVLVTLVEGKVSVADALDPSAGATTLGAPVAAQELAPGERLVADRAGASTVETGADIAKTTAWRRGKLIFEDEPLSAALERMNRYSRIALVAGDVETGRLGVSGVFDTGDTDAFVEALEVYFGVVAERREDGAIVIRAPA